MKANNDKPRHQRKRLMIDPSVQWAIARRITFHWVGFFVLLLMVNSVIGMLISMPQKAFMESAISAARNQMPQIVIMLLVLPIFVRDTIRLSNRFAGPMYRLRIGLGALAEQRPQGTLKFRRSDFWHEVAARFNLVRQRMEQLETRNAELQREVERLRETRSNTALVGRN